MKRIVTMMAALGLVAGACAGGDSESATTTDPAVTTTDPAVQTDEESSTDESSTEDDSSDESVDDGTTDESTADEETDDAASADDSADDESDDDGTDDEGDDGNAAGVGTISSLNDIPERCRDLMGDFLREIEPLVSTVDWQDASLNDFEAIGEDFEAKSNEFDVRGEAEGCNDLDFAGDSEFDLMLDFAREEAPGTIEFLEFISDLGAVGAGDDSAGSGELESCDDGIAFMQDLVDNYDTFADVPASDLLKFQELSLVFISCTPDQLAFFDSPEVADFMGG